MRVHAPQSMTGQQFAQQMTQQPQFPPQFAQAGLQNDDVYEAWQAERQRREEAEAKVQELEGILSRLKHRIAVLEGRKVDRRIPEPAREEPLREDPNEVEDPIDAAICEYLELNPDFPVSIQKVAANHYVFGDRGTVYVTQRGEHIVVRVGGGFKSLQVFMDERALMVNRDSAAASAQHSVREG